jgi:hypothetical protein
MMSYYRFLFHNCQQAQDFPKVREIQARNSPLPKGIGKDAKKMCGGGAEKLYFAKALAPGFISVYFKGLSTILTETPIARFDLRPVFVYT